MVLVSLGLDKMPANTKFIKQLNLCYLRQQINENIDGSIEKVITFKTYWNNKKALWDQGEVAEWRVLKLKSAFLTSFLSNNFDRYGEQMKTNDQAGVDVKQRGINLIMLIIGVTH